MKKININAFSAKIKNFKPFSVHLDVFFLAKCIAVIFLALATFLLTALHYPIFDFIAIILFLTICGILAGGIRAICHRFQENCYRFIMKSKKTTKRASLLLCVLILLTPLYFYYSYPLDQEIISYFSLHLLALLQLVLIFAIILYYDKLSISPLLFSIYWTLYYFFKRQILDLTFLGIIADFSLLVFLLLTLRIIINIKNRIIRLPIEIFLYFIHFILFAGLVGLSRYLAKTNAQLGSQLSFYDIGGIFQTNALEAVGFLITFFSFQELLFFFGISALATVIFIAIRLHAVNLNLPDQKSIFPQKFLPIYSVLALCTIISAWSAGLQQSAIYPLMSTAIQYKKIMKEFVDYAELRKINQAEITARKKESGETYIIVIGESASREHMSAYGYFRDTTPWLKKLTTEENNAVRFTNAYASFCHTVPSLIMALSEANQYNKRSEYQSPNLIDIFNAAGFNTYWISSQDQYSLVDNPLTSIAHSAGHFSFIVNKGYHRTDQDLLPELAKTISNLDLAKNNIIFINLLGSHAPTRTFVPEDYPDNLFDNTSTIEYIGDQSIGQDHVKIINDYDRSIRFTDDVLKEIYELVHEKVSGPKLFMYFSDHGEDIYAERYHNAAKFSWPMARIPFAVHFSEEYAERYPNKINRLKNRKDNIFTLDLLYDLLIGLAAIETPQYDKSVDLSNPDYRLTGEESVTLYSSGFLHTELYYFPEERKITDDPFLISKNNIEYVNNKYPGLFLALHSDTIGMTKDVLDTYGFIGMEVNVTLPGLFMGHGVKPTMEGEEPYAKYLHTNTLEDFLNEIPQEKIQKLWLDLKMVNDETIEELHLKLNELDKKFSLKQRTILEVAGKTDKLAVLADEGWNTSYYYFTLREFPKTEAGLKALAQEIADGIHREKTKALSFYADLYPFVKKYVEPLIPESVQYHTWAVKGLPSIASKNFIDAIEQNPIVNDPRVITILVTPDFKFGINLIYD